MSDLISRSELLHYMKNTELSQYIDEVNMGNDNYNSTPLYDYVKEMQTAYSVDEVIKELEENASRYTKKYTTPYGNNGYKDTKAISVNKAIEIVKHGCVSDDVCEWKLEDDNLMTGCGDYFNLYDNCTDKFKFCPTCGKKIKVVE